MNWKTEKRKLSELVPHQSNPRILTKKQAQDLKKSLKKFSLAEIPVINTDNAIIAGHQRIKILSELNGPDFEIDVRVPEKTLTQKQVDEYLIRSNKNTGEWDWDVLANSFDQEELQDWGFEETDFFGQEQLEEPSAEKKDLIIPQKFEVVIECEDESDQEGTYNTLIGQGFKCRLLSL